METPEFLGPYQVGEVLGRGGMGSVYTGVHAKTGDRVAVKLIAPHISDEMRFRYRFDKEIETLRRLKHENIVQLIAYGEEHGQLFYAMELVEGESLQTRIRREKRLNWMTAINIAIQTCSALKHAHDIGVIHRDLKPANLILTGNESVKLIDFGIARIFGSGEQTAVGSVLGTADYMAPEQAGNLGITPRTDLYAMGSVLYAMLAGRPPFKGKSVTEVIESLKRDQPIPLDMVNLDLPEALVELVHELLSKDPDQRPPTALAVMNRLKAMRAGLQRELTATGKESETQVKRGTGYDLSGLVGDQIPTPANPSAQTLQASGFAPQDKTLVDPSLGATQKPQDPVRDDTSERSETRTHFQTVDSQAAGSGMFGQPPTDSESGFARRLSIALMIAALVIGVIVIVKSLQKPPPDDMYDEIVSTRNAGTLSDAKQEIDRFLKLFPDDPRYKEVQDMSTTLELEALLRRLRLQNKLDVTPLNEHEKSFLNAMDLRETDSRLAIEKLKQWSTVFVDSTTHIDDVRGRMGELAEFEIKRLTQRGPIKKVDRRLQELLDRIKAGFELPTDERRNLLNGMIELYAAEPWAQAAVQQAQQQLDELNESRKLPNTPRL